MTTSTRSPRSSRAAGRTGSQEPTRCVVPEFATSMARQCHDVNAVGGLVMLEWQDLLMEGWLGMDALGRWTAPICGAEVPRQNGKSLGLVEPRCNWGMIVRHEEVIYTAQLQKTATETFEDMAEFFDQPKLRRYVKDIKTALGREQIVLKDGGRIKFLARTRNGGRGQHGDLLIFDEALKLSAEDQASFLPAISASRNPQTIYVSSPPEDDEFGDVFSGVRAAALSGRSEKTAWAEWGIDEPSPSVIADVDTWYATNPSLGILIDEETVRTEFEQMPARKFAIERLGWWPKARRADMALDAEMWDASASDGPADGDIEKKALGVKFMPGGQICVSIAARSGGKLSPSAHVELLFDENASMGLQWLVDWILDRIDELALVAVDGKSGAGNLADALTRRGFPKKAIRLMTPGDVVTAASMVGSMLAEGRLTHYAGAAIDMSAKSATRRKVGGDGVGFGGESCAIESAAAAVWAVVTTKRDPKRKMMIG
ncbi:MAG: hypothetical protein IJG84_12515 [Kiritimatiellae bacterium]|nr:hypothetical protein [Kiritimatiellia bacterium]